MLKMIAAFTLLMCACLKAEIYVLQLSDLKFDEKTDDLSNLLNGERSYDSWMLRREANMSARTPLGTSVFLAPKTDRREKRGDAFVAIELDENKKFSGYIDFNLSIDSIDEFLGEELNSYQFSFDPKNHKPAKKEEFEKIKKKHYSLLAKSGYLGMPWFNEQANGEKVGTPVVNVGRNRSIESFSFYTGGRAISDNLALDRELRLMKDDIKEVIDVSAIPGIKTKAIDWKNLMPKEEVKVDSLAMLIPEDQHVLICPSLADMEKIVSLIEKEGSPLAQSFTVRNPFRALPSKYKKQLGLDFPPMLTNLIPVKSVAVTGYDPFFPTGTDVAVLLETDFPNKLQGLIPKTMHDADNHMAMVGNVLVVSNSEKQLARIQAVHAGKIKSLGSLDEYKFFRHRYPVAEKRTGFVFLSDACIRRWGGPRMRIAASRRTKSIAALNYLTARSISEGKVVDLNDDQRFLLGNISMGKGLRVESEKMGDLQFMKPTIEMSLDKVTQTEGDAYLEWKRGYEEGWRQVFDPIGFSFNIDKDTKELDLTVMPLTVNTEYADFIEIAGKSLLSSRARIAENEHIFTASMAIDKDGEMLSDFDTSLSGMMPGLKVKPLGWLGSSITLFAEKDARWQLMEDAKDVRASDILGVPIGLRVEHTSQIKLASFLLALRATVAEVAPDALKWENKKHGDATYVVVRSKEELVVGEDIKLYYWITKDTLTLTLREDVIKREIDRQKAEQKPELTPLEKNADHFYLKSSSRMLMSFSSASGASLVKMRRTQSYRAIPILNEWRRIFKSEDPIGFHYTTFGGDIFCPGGKGYRWNEKAMTMESVVYGYPAAPKPNAENDHFIDAFGNIESSIRFENDGLRVRLKITRSERNKKSGVIFPGTKDLGNLEYPTEPGVKWEYDVVNNGGNVVETLENVSFENGELKQKFLIFYGNLGKLEKYTGRRVLTTQNGLRLKSARTDGEVPFEVAYNPAALTYPARFILGRKEFETYDFSRNNEPSKDEVTNSWSVTGVEDVEAAGILYKNCIIFEMESYSVSKGFIFKKNNKYWVKQKVGLVKFEEVDRESRRSGILKSITKP